MRIQGLFKYLTLVLMFSGIVFFCAAGEGEARDRNLSVHFSSLNIHESNLGLGIRLSEQGWLALNIDNLGARRPVRFSSSVYYMIPRRFIIWNIYGGLGINYSQYQGMNPHILAGSEFLWFFTEYEFQLQQQAGFFRAGFRLRF